jgi:hypothetical protein
MASLGCTQKDQSTDGEGGGTATGSGGGATTGSAGSSGGGGGEIVCPTSAPFDTEAPGIKEKCTRVVYVAGGYAVRRIVSYDGATWENDVSDPEDGQGQDEHAISGIAIGRGVIVATGDGALRVSKDGKNWDVVDSVPGTNFSLHSSKVAFAQDRFYLVGNGGTWTSDDGLNWSGVLGEDKFPGTDVTGSFGGHTQGWAYGAGNLVFTNDDARVRVFDGTTWSENKVGNYSGWLDSIAFGNGRFVVTGRSCCGAQPPTADGLRAHSADGVTWEDVVTNDTGPQLDFGPLFFDGSRFLAAGSKDGLTSVDGVTWTPQQFSESISSVAVYEGNYLGSSGHQLYTSKDGISWTKTHDDQSTGSPWEMYVVAVGRILK